MTDPQTNDLIAKTVGEIAGKVIEKSVDLGDKFIKWFFKNHKQKVKENAEKNAKELLSLLAVKINHLEQTITGTETKKKIENALDSPDFSKILEQSIKISALSEDKEKKDILAQLLIHRLLVDNETTESLIVKIACEQLEYLNNNHLKILGLIYSMRKTSTDFDYDNRERQRFTDEEIKKQLIDRFAPYYKMTVNQLELEHLEFHNCIKMNYGLTTFLSPLILPFEIYSDKDKEISFYKTNLGAQLLIDWTNNNLQHGQLSVVGQLIGQYFNDLLMTKK